MIRNKRFFDKNLPKDNVANLSEVRLSNIKYIYVWILYYAFVFIFFTLWSNSDVYSAIFTTVDRNNLLYAMLLFTAIFLFMFKRHYFKTASIVGAIGVVIFLILIVSSKDEILKSISLIMLGISLSVVNVGILYTFAFILNNTEKILAVISSNILVLVLTFLPLSNLDNVFLKVLVVILFAIALFPVFLFKQDDIHNQESLGNEKDVKKEDNGASLFNQNIIVKKTEHKEKEKEINIPARVYLYLLIGFASTLLCIGVGRASLIINLENSELNLLMFYNIGAILGCVIYILIVSLSNTGIQLGLNSTFGIFAMALFFDVFSGTYPYYSTIFSFLLGISTTCCIINNFYLLGLISKKYHSLAYLRLAFIFVFVIGGLASIILNDFMTNDNFFNVTVVATLFSLCIMISLLIISPILNDTLYSEEWVKDTNRFEITPEEKDFLQSYGLTGREVEVCKLLIEGDTMRKISAKLSIAYPTVNTYCTAIYRKLNINSRTELLIRFMENKKDR